MGPKGGNQRIDFEVLNGVAALVEFEAGFGGLDGRDVVGF